MIDLDIDLVLIKRTVFSSSFIRDDLHVWQVSADCSAFSVAAEGISARTLITVFHIVSFSHGFSPLMFLNGNAVFYDHFVIIVIRVDQENRAVFQRRRHS